MAKYVRRYECLIRIPVYNLLYKPPVYAFLFCSVLKVASSCSKYATQYKDIKHNGPLPNVCYVTYNSTIPLGRH